MMAKKLIAGVVSLSMLATLSMSAFAASTVSITGSNTTAVAGGTFTMTLSLGDVPTSGINACYVDVAYDSSLVTITSVVSGSIVPADVDGFDGATAFEYYDNGSSVATMFTTGSTDSSNWITTSGTFVTITGTVNASASAGDVATFTVSSATVGTVDASSNITDYTVKTTAGTVTVEGSSSSDVLYGDADCDGDVDVTDVILIGQYSGGSGTITAQGLINADVDINGSVSFDDALYVMRSLTELLTLPVA